MKPELIVLIRGEYMVIKLVTHLSTFLLMQRTSMLSFPLKDSVPSLLMAHMPYIPQKKGQETQEPYGNRDAEASPFA